MTDTIGLLESITLYDRDRQEWRTLTRNTDGWIHIPAGFYLFDIPESSPSLLKGESLAYNAERNPKVPR